MGGRSDPHSGVVAHLPASLVDYNIARLSHPSLGYQTSATFVEAPSSTTLKGRGCNRSPDENSAVGIGKRRETDRQHVLSQQQAGTGKTNLRRGLSLSLGSSRFCDDV
jgi:hypothetical protein